MIDFNRWKENIYSDIEELSDKSFQEKVWLGKNDKYVSSFVEVMCRLFDDNRFEDEFWKEENLQGLNFTPQLLMELKLLKEMLNSYEEKPTDIEILNDPKWDKIIAQAKKVKSLWQ
jgi:hypothetical protein